MLGYISFYHILYFHLIVFVQYIFQTKNTSGFRNWCFFNSASSFFNVYNRLIYSFYRNRVHPTFLCSWILCQDNMTVIIAIWAASIRKCRSEEGDDGGVHGVCDVEGTSITGNMKGCHFFQCRQFQQVGFSHEVHRIGRWGDFLDGLPHIHFAFGAGNHCSNLVIGQFFRQFAPVFDGPFFIISPCARNQYHVGAVNAVAVEKGGDGFHFVVEVSQGKFDFVHRAAQVAHHVQELFDDVVTMFVNFRNGFAEKETAFSGVVVADSSLPAGEEGDQAALGNHLQVDHQIEVFLMQVMPDLFPVRRLFDSLAVHQVNVVQPRLPRKNPRKGRVDSPGNFRLRVRFPEHVQRRQGVNDVSQGAHLDD